MRFASAAAVLVLAIVAWAVWGRGGVHTDGPLTVQDAPWLGSSGSDARLGGELSIEGDRVRLNGASVLWPDGTSWDADERAVVLPGGRPAHDGDVVSGGGGAYDGPGGEEVYVFNASEHLDLTPGGRE